MTAKTTEPKAATAAKTPAPKTTAGKRKADAAVATSQSIDNQIEAFLSSGGEIQKIPNGKSGQTYSSPRAGKPAAKPAAPAKAAE
ncbi:MAG: hypothetical protein V7756_18615 [Halopseudomonas sp.]|uniref:hypothetical protein n=1 Tax=Halopseudomonas sp. TaxID=2901191 RepID=UPI0030025CCE